MTSKPFTSALVAASDFNAGRFVEQWSAGAFDLIVAVDGGFAHLQGVGCDPDVAIGDFDSLGRVPACQTVIEHPTHKDKSDLELALDYVAARGTERVVVFGALGGRLDHSVGNLQLCASFAERGMDVELVDAGCSVSVLVGPGTLNMPAMDGGTVSVFSAVDESRGVTERGMEYPLDDATLTNRTTWGLSNELTGLPASVTVEEGTLFIFHPIA